MLTTEEKLRYNRQIILPGIGESGQEKLKAAKVLVVGAGGLGSPVLLYLAAAGIGNIGIIDGDNIDKSNLQRQILYTTEDENKSKSETAKEKLTSLNPLVKITSYSQQLNADNALSIIPDYDIVVDGSDNFPTRYLVNDACVMLNKPFVSGAVYQFEGQVSVFNYNNGPTYRCLFPESPGPEESPDCSQAGVLGALTGIIGSMQATEVIKIVTGIGTVLSGRMMLINILENTTSYFDIVLNPSNKKISSLNEYINACNNENINSVSVNELQQMIASKEAFQLIDVREENEFAQKNIGGKLIPLSELDKSFQNITRDKKVIIHCQSGKRSTQAIDYLQSQHKFTNLYNLEGGLNAWIHNDISIGINN